jgi:hypothetical protein
MDDEVSSIEILHRISRRIDEMERKLEEARLDGFGKWE